MQKEIDALLDADRRFAAETAARGGDGWAEFFHRDGIMFPPAGVIEGREAIREAMVPVFASGSRLVWEPTTAVVAESGDLGYTVGRWESTAPPGEGEPAVTHGNYVSVWRKVPGEGWRVVVDIGNRDR
jgi:ketosteroid isomerase-like protein